jgi:hypothetical protein
LPAIFLTGFFAAFPQFSIARTVFNSEIGCESDAMSTRDTEAAFISALPQDYPH